MSKEDVNNFAVYLNNEYIGEAEEIQIIKGSRQVLPVLKIYGKLQLERKL